MNKELWLSDNFQLKEFLVSQDYPEIAAKMKLNQMQINTIDIFVHLVLQPLRVKFGRVEVLSGYRNPELNGEIGGSDDSDHMYCTAADIYLNVPDLQDVFQWMLRNSPFRQLIYYPVQKFIHVSFNMPNKEYKHEAFIKTEEDYRSL